MYITMKICHRPYTIQRVETGREGGRVPVTDPLPPGWAPREEWPLQVSQGKLWLPGPGPSLLAGAREEGIVGQWLM